jgi:hypothetical protein
MMDGRCEGACGGFFPGVSQGSGLSNVDTTPEYFWPFAFIQTIERHSITVMGDAYHAFPVDTLSDWLETGQRQDEGQSIVAFSKNRRCWSTHKTTPLACQQGDWRSIEIVSGNAVITKIGFDATRTTKSDEEWILFLRGQ